jgi:hypothetical protein
MVIVQAKEGFYHDWHPTYMFLLLPIQVLGAYYNKVDNFFHQCASLVQLAKAIGGPPLVIICAFFRLTTLSGFPSFSFSNMVLATCGGFGT